VVHNTLWIVGHFHQMALLNIGLVVFAAVYYFVPELTGKPLWSEALAKWHLLLTFVGATVNSAFWLVQGLEGAPRRFAVLPHRYDSLTKWALPWVAMIAVGQVLFVWNMVQTLRGAERRSADTPSAVGEAVVILVALTVAAAAFGVGIVVGRHTKETESGAAAASTTTAASTTPSSASGAAGKAVFASAGCSGCHTLKDAGASGNVGPNLDDAHPSSALVAARVSNGKGGMPSFSGQLTAAQIKAVAQYVASAAGG
jgi:mono/diheme cytochrome c family protein